MAARIYLVFGSALALAGGACHRPAPPVEPPPAVEYHGRGVVQAIRSGAGTVVIAHEAIAGYMPAMTMEFRLADPTPPAAGDCVEFQLWVTERRSWVDHLQKVGTAPLAPTPAPANPETLLRLGDLAPDCALIDSRGIPFQLRDLRGSVVALSFIFTRCPLPEYCPRVSAEMAAAQRALAAAPPGATPWRLLSISFDPAYDTPARLAEYAGRVGADPARWTLATGSEREILRLGAAFDLTVEWQGGQLSHNLRTVVLDPAGQVRQILRGNSWSAQDLISEMRAAANPAPAGADKSSRPD